MLLFLIVNEDVLLIQGSNMYNLLMKLYSFTPKFHILPQGSAWS